MLVSYQVTGLNKDWACISLFEFDVHENSINPMNFIIISQKIGKADSAKASFSSMNSHLTFDSKGLSNQIGTSGPGSTNNNNEGSKPEIHLHPPA